MGFFPFVTIDSANTGVFVRWLPNPVKSGIPDGASVVRLMPWNSHLVRGCQLCQR